MTVGNPAHRSRRGRLNKQRDIDQPERSWTNTPVRSSRYESFRIPSERVTLDDKMF